MSHQAAGDTWLSVLQVASHLGLTMRTVRILIDSGELEADIAIPPSGPKAKRRTIRISANAVGEYIERARVKPGELTHLYPNWPGGRYR